MPLDAIAEAGMTPEEVMSGVCDERYHALIEGQIRLAEEHFERAMVGVPMLAPAARLPVGGGVHRTSHEHFTFFFFFL